MLIILCNQKQLAAVTNREVIVAVRLQLVWTGLSEYSIIATKEVTSKG